MEFDQAAKRLQELLSNDMDVNLFLGRFKRHLERLVQCIIDQLKQTMESDQPLKQHDLLKNDVIIFTKELVLLMITEKMEPTTKEFLEIYGLIMLNWANATDNTDTIKIITAINTMLEYHKSTYGLIQAMQILIDYCRQFNSFNPPAFNVSKSYLESLYEDIKKGEDLNDRNK